MKAMVLAAGVGSRLKPHTDKAPKALVDVGGATMLEVVLKRLKAAGVTEAVVNLHHFPDMIRDYLAKHKGFGLRIEVSHEPELLETGGGLKKAARFFDDGRPFFLHNADIYSEADLRAMSAAHDKSGALATLAVHRREAERAFLFAKDGRLVGRRAQDQDEWAGIPVDSEALPFDGIHVISPALLPRITENGAFSITKTYLRLAGQGHRIQAFRTDPFYWNTVGDPPRLEEVRARVRAKGLTL